MKIYTVLSNSYDPYLFQYWIMTTTNINKVNEYIEGIHGNDEDIMQFSNSHKLTKVFFYADEENITDNPDCGDKGESHIVIIVTRETK